MQIRHSDFDNGGEVDFGAWHYDIEKQKNGYKARKNYGLRMRRKEGEERVYEVYKMYFTDRSEKVSKEGILEDCIAFINKNYNYDDEVVTE